MYWLAVIVFATLLLGAVWFLVLCARVLQWFADSVERDRANQYGYKPPKPRA